MSTPFKAQTEKAYERHVFLAVELLDAVTLTRVSEGVKVVVDGLQGKPILNSSGYFVWLRENNPTIRKITADPGVLPYETRRARCFAGNIPENNYRASAHR